MDQTKKWYKNKVLLWVVGIIVILIIVNSIIATVDYYQGGNAPLSSADNSNPEDLTAQAHGGLNFGAVRPGGIGHSFSPGSGFPGTFTGIVFVVPTFNDGHFGAIFGFGGSYSPSSGGPGGCIKGADGKCPYKLN